MKRLLLSTAIAAMAGPAWGQANMLPVASIICPVNESQDEIILAVSCNTTDTDEVVAIGQAIGASDVDKLTSPVSVLTQTDIQNRNQAVIADLLRTVPGLAVSQNGGAGSLTQIRLRGSEANQVLVIIDGIEVANPSDGAFDFGGLRTEDIVKIEVLRGEQSALYGSDAVGGVINIITRAGNTTESWNASVEGGSRDTFEGQVSAVVPLGGAALTFNGNIFTTQGFDISGLDGEADGANSRALNVGLNNVELGGVNFSAKLGRSIRETDFDGDTDFDGRLNNTLDETDVTTDVIRVDASFELAGFQHKIAASGARTDTDTVGGFASRSIGTRQLANWAAKRDFSEAHSLTVLAEVEEESYEIRPNFTEPGAEPENRTYGLAGDYRYTGDALTFTASARHDINDLFEDVTTFRIGAGYAFPWDGRMRASAGTGVKNPTLIELFGFFPASRFTGNADLQPETSRGLSVGYDQTIGTFEFSVDYFYSELEDEITTLFNPDFTTSVINLNTDSTRSGVELAASWEATERLRLYGSASFLDSDQDGIEEIRRPHFLASGTASWDATDDLTLTVNIDHNGEQLDTDFATFSTVELESFTLIGANARYRLNEVAALTLRGANLLNEDYEEVVGFVSAGRAVFAGLELNF